MLKKFRIILLLCVGCHSLLGQPFSTTTSASLGTFNYLTNGITVFGLGNLDGINLGVTSLRLNVTGTTFFGSSTKIDLYLVAPNGNAVYIMFNDVSFSNADFIFTNIATSPIRYTSFNSANAIANPYQPYGDLNAINTGQPANGVWKLYARTTGLPGTINSWSITFGKTNISPGAANQACPTAAPLVNTTLTGNSTLGTNKYNGIVLNPTNPQPQVSQSYVESGGSNPMQSSVWYSFVPLCKDDVIEIAGSIGYIYSGIWTGDCGSLTRLKILPSFFTTTQTYSSLNFTPGQKYYLVMDSDQGDPFSYEIKWHKGSSCTQLNSINTINPAKPSYCASDTIHVKYTASGTFGTNNVFTAQLSDASGDFASYKTVGTNALNSGTITATLPNNLAVGSGYKLRVVSNNPVASTLVESGSFQIKSFPSTPTVINGDLSVCANETNVAYSTSTVQTALKYRWKFPSGTQVIPVPLSGDSSSLSVNYGTIGGTISLQAVNECGTSAALVQNVTVKRIVVPTVAIEGNSSFCAGSTASFKASSKNPGDSPIFTWWVNKIQQQMGPDSSLSLSNVQNNDTINVQLNSNIECASPDSVLAVPKIIEVGTSLVPTVKILGNLVSCKGEGATYKAEPRNEGTTPHYTWKVNGTIRGTDSPTFSYNQPENHDTIIVELQSDDPCANPPTAVSEPIYALVKEKYTPSVAISTLQQGTCQGDTFRFEASALETGTLPKFKWTINGAETGDTSIQFFHSGSKTGDTVGIRMISNASCLTNSMVSDSLTLSITDTTHVSLALIGDSQICPVQRASFRASLNPAQQNPLFNWFVNGKLLPDDHGDLLSAIFQNSDRIRAELSNAPTCARPFKIESSKLVLSAKTPVEPVTFILGPVEGCSGDLLNYFATVSQGGTSPRFQWYINDAAQVNDTLDTFSTNRIRSGDSVFTKVKSSEDCAIQEWTKSNVYDTIRIEDTVTTSVSILNEPLYCTGQSVAFQTQSHNLGNSPTYAWSIDGTPYLQDSSILQLPTTLQAGSHEVSLTVNNLAKCARPDPISVTSTFTLKDSVNSFLNITGDTNLCIGSSATYRLAIPLNLSDMQYNWKLNGLPTGLNDSTFTYDLPKDNDSISLLITTEELCMSHNQLQSNRLVIHVRQSMDPKVSISTTQSEVCIGKELTYHASVENPGVNEHFQWLEDGQQIIGSNSSNLVYILSSPKQIALKYGTDLDCGPLSMYINAPEVLLKSPPTLSSISGPADFCWQDKDVLFSTDLINDVTYTWTIPLGAFLKNDGNRILLSSAPNTIGDTLKVKAQNDCGYGNEVYTILFPKNCSTLFIPNAIATNEADGNGLWQIKGLENYSGVQVNVFNRWGDKVFHSQGYTTPWDGSLKGKALPAGTYYYVIQGAGEKPITGDLTILH